MLNSRTIGIILIVCVVSAVVFSLAYTRATRARPVGWDELERAEPKVVAATALHEFDAIEKTVPILDPDELRLIEDSDESSGRIVNDAQLEARRSRLREALSNATIRGENLVSEESLDILLSEASSFLAMRFAQHDPDRYIQWREDRGYEFIGWHWLVNRWRIQKGWRTMFPDDDTPPESGDHRPHFAQAFRATLDRSDGFNRPTAVASSPEGLAVVIGRGENFGYVMNESMQGAWPPELWAGSVSAGCGKWWTPPRDSKALVTETGSCTYAKVGTILEFQNGDRRPVITRWVWDDREGWWFIQGMGVSYFEHPGPRASAMYF